MLKPKRRLIFVSFVALVAVALVACGNQGPQPNTALNGLDVGELDDDVVAVIVNNPSGDQLDSVSELDEKVLQEDMQTMLVVPRYADSDVVVKSLVYENDELKEDETLYEQTGVQDGYGLLLHVVRPEGPPIVKVIVTGDGQTSEYIVSYDGKDGNPPVEYMRTAGE